MRNDIDERCVRIGWYLFENSSTVRATAEVFRISKTTVHNDLHRRLPKVHPQLAREVQKVLETNRKERNIRGGKATREKYRLLRLSVGSDD